jgi:hypothetical protein
MTTPNTILRNGNLSVSYRSRELKQGAKQAVLNP